MLDMVQTVLEPSLALVGFKEDDVHFMSVAVRESVVNAIKHGNRMDESKRVAVEFTLAPEPPSTWRCAIEGMGFDPESVADPVAQENLLKADGRGIFFMRSFMDTVLVLVPEGRRHRRPHDARSWRSGRLSAP